jgi:hypothetical protein
MLDLVNFPGAFATYTYHFHYEFEANRVGLSYHFDAPSSRGIELFRQAIEKASDGVPNHESPKDQDGQTHFHNRSCDPRS